MVVHEVVETLLVIAAAAFGFFFGSSMMIIPNPSVPTSSLNIAPFIFSLLIGVLVWIVLDTVIAFDQDRSAIRAPKFLGGETIHLIFIPAMIVAYSYGMYLNYVGSQGSQVGFQNAALDILRFLGFAWNLLIANAGVSAAGVLFGIIFAAFIDTSVK